MVKTSKLRRRTRGLGDIVSMVMLDYGQFIQLDWSWSLGLPVPVSGKHLVYRARQCEKVSRVQRLSKISGKILAQEARKSG